jgi:hypothetical protein
MVRTHKITKDLAVYHIQKMTEEEIEEELELRGIRAR